MNPVDITPAEAFTFTRTLERRLVNRRSVAEVFLTDFHPVSDREWIVGAQLPIGHAYFTDHIDQPRHYDVLLILECCRQAGTYGGYTQFGSSLDTVNMVSSLQLSIDRPDLLRIGTAPGRLIVHVEAVDVVRTGSRTKSATPRMTLFLDGRQLGTASIPVTLASPKLFSALRSRVRQGPPVLTSTLRTPEAAAVAPASVGRSRPANVLLAGANRTNGRAEAVLSLRADNCNILDHDYDHIPAMALADAAVQLMTWDSGRVRSTISGLQANFHRFAEVDEPVMLDGQLLNESEYRVRFTQAGAETGTVSMRLSPLDARVVDG